MERVFGYARVSSPGQVGGDGFDRQLEAINAYAKAHRLEVVNFYREEGVSGTSETRPALANLMVDLKQNGHGVKTVIVERLDRLARDLMVQEAVIQDFQRHGVDLISATEGPDLLSGDPTRKLIRQVFGAVAEYDKSMLVLKLRTARERVKAKTGKCDGRKGYYETDHGKVVLARIKQLKRKRRDMKPLSATDIAEVLNREGLMTLTGKPWTTASILDKAGMDLSTIPAILRHKSATTTARYMHSLRGVRAALDDVFGQGVDVGTSDTKKALGR